MKKLLAASYFLFPSICLASSVSMYGVLDGGVQVSKAPGQDTLVQMANGFQSGNRIGFLGTEDLGGGYSVNFRLEQGFKLSNGAEHKTGLSFSRQATLGVKGKFGELAFGRMGGLSSDCGSYSILPVSFIGTSFSAKGDSYSTIIVTNRYNNSIVYKTPDFNGLTVSMMYSNGLTTDEQKWSLDNHYYGIGAVFNKEKATITAIAEYLDNKADRSAAKNKLDGTTILTLGGGYDFGFLNLAATYQFSNKAMLIENYMDASKFIGSADLHKGARQHAVVLSGDVPLAGGRFGLQVNYANGKFLDVKEGEKDYSVISIGSAYLYPFSKRTNLYVYAGYGATKKALKTADANDLRGYSVALGLRHKF